MSSNKSTTRTITIKGVDDTTAVLLGVARTIRSVRMEIHFAEMAMRALDAAEEAAAADALTLGVALSVALPVLGMVAAAIGILAGIEITRSRAAIPVGQTMPGQFRMVQANGPVNLDKGEIISRPMEGGPGLGGGGINIEQVNISNEGMPADQAWAHVRSRLRMLTFAWPR
jgi:hypothetical protein